MRRLTVSVLMVFLMTTYPLTAFAQNGGNGGGQAHNQSGSVKTGDHEQEVDTENEVEDSVMDSVYSDEDNEQTKEQKPWKVARAALKEERAALETLKEGIENQINDLEKQLEAAKASNDLTLINNLQQQILELKVTFLKYKVEMKSKMLEMKIIMKQKYNAAELKAILAISKELDKLPGVAVLPVENVISEDSDIKFDTPPVIKDGRTLLPVRAISEGMGAEVVWNSEKRTATITKGDKVIVFDFSSNKVYVNNELAAIDVPAQLMNKRTMVPLRFIAENLGLKVQWDQETETVELE